MTPRQQNWPCSLAGRGALSIVRVCELVYAEEDVKGFPLSVLRQPLTQQFEKMAGFTWRKHVLAFTM